MADEKYDLNEDELVGFIIRNAWEENIKLDYETVLAVLAGQMDFYKEKGLVPEADTAER
jgi:hypothetical protein